MHCKLSGQKCCSWQIGPREGLNMPVCCAAHFKHWLKWPFLIAEKMQKRKKFATKFCKKGSLKFAPKHWLNVLFPEKTFFLNIF